MRRQPQHTGRTLICQVRFGPHGPLIHASGSSAYEIFCSLFADELLALLMEETNRGYDQTVAALGGLTTLCHRSSYACGECNKALCNYPCFKRFHTLTVYKAECTDAFHSLPQVPVGSGVQEGRPGAKRDRRHWTSRPWNSTPTSK